MLRGEDEAGNGGRPSAWILILLLLALMGVSLVHEPETDAAANAGTGLPEVPGNATE